MDTFLPLECFPTLCLVPFLHVSSLMLSIFLNYLCYITWLKDNTTSVQICRLKRCSTTAVTLVDNLGIPLQILEKKKRITTWCRISPRMLKIKIRQNNSQNNWKLLFYFYLKLFINNNIMETFTCHTFRQKPDNCRCRLLLFNTCYQYKDTSRYGRCSLSQGMWLEGEGWQHLSLSYLTPVTVL